MIPNKMAFLCHPHHQSLVVGNIFAFDKERSFYIMLFQNIKDLWSDSGISG